MLETMPRVYATTFWGRTPGLRMPWLRHRFQQSGPFVVVQDQTMTRNRALRFEPDPPGIDQALSFEALGDIADVQVRGQLRIDSGSEAAHPVRLVIRGKDDGPGAQSGYFLTMSPAQVRLDRLENGDVADTLGEPVASATLDPTGPWRRFVVLMNGNHITAAVWSGTSNTSFQTATAVGVSLEDPNPLPAGFVSVGTRSEGSAWSLDAIRIEPYGAPSRFDHAVEAGILDWVLPGGLYADRALPREEFGTVAQTALTLEITEVTLPDGFRPVLTGDYRPIVIWEDSPRGPLVIPSGMIAPNRLSIPGFRLEDRKVWIAEPYDFEVELSRIYMRDREGLPEMQGRLQLNYGELLLDNTGPVEVEVRPTNRRVYNYRRTFLE